MGVKRKEVKSMNKYIEIDYKKVEGYKDLTNAAKETFIRTYEIHNASLGIDLKSEYIPIKVMGQQDDLAIHFKNGAWLHYTTNNEWY